MANLKVYRSDKAFKDLNEDELLEEILARKELIGQMVGSLYPSILRDEIEVIYERWTELRIAVQSKSGPGASLHPDDPRASHR